MASKLWGWGWPIPVNGNGGSEEFKFLLKYGQDLPFAGWYTANREHADTRPFDGTLLYLTGGSNGVFVSSGTPLTLASVEAEMVGFHEAGWTRLIHNFPVIRTTEDDTAIDYWDDEMWGDICTNAAAFVEGVQGQFTAGIAWDNEHYHSVGPSLFDWVDGAGIDPTHTLEQSRAKVRQRGEEFMSALISAWPEVKFLVLHGPYVSDPRTGVDTWTSAPFWNPVDSANELHTDFFQGLLDAAEGTDAEVINAAQVYAVRTQTDVDNVRDWILNGLPDGESTLVASELVSGWNQRFNLGHSIGDFDEFDSFNVQPAEDIEAQIGFAFNRASYVVYYTEEHDWWEGGWGDHLDIDAPEQAAWKEAVTNAWEAK